MIIINVDRFYSNRVLYPFIPALIFDALEAAYLSGDGTTEVPEGEYNKTLYNLKCANLCPGQ